MLLFRLLLQQIHSPVHHMTCHANAGDMPLAPLQSVCCISFWPGRQSDYIRCSNPDCHPLPDPGYDTRFFLRRKGSTASTISASYISLPSVRHRHAAISAVIRIIPHQKHDRLMFFSFHQITVKITFSHMPQNKQKERRLPKEPP